MAGLFHGGGFELLLEQALANGVTIVYSFIVTTVIMLALKATIGVRVSEDVEASGLDLAEHAEPAYHSGGSSALERSCPGDDHAAAHRSHQALQAPPGKGGPQPRSHQPHDPPP